MAEERLKCRAEGCDNRIQPATAKRNEGYCGLCHGRIMRKQTTHETSLRFFGTTDPEVTNRIIHPTGDMNSCLISKEEAIERASEWVFNNNFGVKEFQSIRLMNLPNLAGGGKLEKVWVVCFEKESRPDVVDCPSGLSVTVNAETGATKSTPAL